MIAIPNPICIPMVFELTDDPAQVVEIHFPGPDQDVASFRRTPYAALPVNFPAEDTSILAHFREEVEEWARHLVVLDNDCLMVICVDEYNPDMGHVENYQLSDVESPAEEAEDYDGTVPYQGQYSGEIHGIEATPALPAEGLAWGKEAPSPDFIKKVIEIADEVGTNPSWLMTQFWGESRFQPQANLTNGVSSNDPSRIGKKTIGGGLFGLMKQWSKPALGVNFSDFMKMTDLEQLEVARKFYGKAKGKLKSMDDVFTYTFWPAALHKKSNYVLMRKGDGVYEQNKQMDVRKVGYITKGDAASLRFKLYQDGMRDAHRLDSFSEFAVQGLGAIQRPLVAVRRPTGLPTARGTIVVHRGPRIQLGQIRGAAIEKSLGKEAMPKFLANCQRDLTTQAILQFVTQELEQNARAYRLSDGEKQLLESIKKLQWSQEKIEATQNNEHMYLKELGGRIREYFMTLFRMKDDIQNLVEDNPTPERQITFLAIDELLSLQEEAGGEKVLPVAFPRPYLNEVMEDWVLDLAEAFDIDEDELDRPEVN
jgi:hypothetical protein